jgi:three-Cys-motif partner protein
MSLKKFFTKTTRQSIIKTKIVSKYFWAWAKVIIPSTKKGSNKIAYIDLFAGPGRYKDGTKSTPLLILEQAIADQNLRDMLVTIFNDKDKNYINSLKEEIDKLSDIKKLKHTPQVIKHQIGSGELLKIFENKNLIPTLLFVDPWGYQGLSLRLISSVLKDWGCECIIFFNYNRINMGISNPVVEGPMKAIFEERTEKLKNKLINLSSKERELTITEEIFEALQEMGGKFVLPFCFKNTSGKRTKHYLIFVSKHFKGYEIMKDIMAKESSNIAQGVSFFEYCSADSKQPLLFELNRPLDELGGMLLNKYAGKKLTMYDLYREHSVGKRYIKRNYKYILLQLEAEKKIRTIPPQHKRHINTFGDKVVIHFPKRS